MPAKVNLKRLDPYGMYVELHGSNIVRLADIMSPNMVDETVSDAESRFFYMYGTFEKKASFTADEIRSIFEEALQVIREQAEKHASLHS